MISFEWVDRHGVAHQLSSPMPIDDEAEAISQEIDQIIGRMENASPTKKSELRLTIRSHGIRLQQLQEDAKNWNCRASQQVDTDAAQLAESIVKLMIELESMIIAVVLHQEHETIMMDAHNRDRMLDGETTQSQRTAITHSNLEPKPRVEATRREVHEWLKADPVFYRPRSDEGGWFEWSDAQGVVHRVLSPLRIEKEIVTIADDLQKLLPVLRNKVSQNEKANAVEAVSSVTNRLSVLQADLERFTREQGEREEDEWQKWETEWKKTRQAR